MREHSGVGKNAVRDAIYCHLVIGALATMTRKRHEWARAGTHDFLIS